MSELSAAFDGLNTAFNTSYDHDDVDAEDVKAVQVIENEIADIEKRKNDVKTGLIEMQDSDFLTKEIKSLVLSSRGVLQRLDDEIKIGSNGRMWEVYAAMMNAISNQYKELRMLNESIVKFSMEQKHKNINDIQGNDKIALTADQLLDMVKAASDKSEMNNVKAEFTIEDDE